MIATASNILAVARTVVAIEKTVAAVARTMVAIEKTMVAIELSVAAVARTVVAIEKTVAAVARTVVAIENTMVAIELSVAAVARTVVVVAPTMVAIGRTKVAVGRTVMAVASTTVAIGRTTVAAGRTMVAVASTTVAIGRTTVAAGRTMAAIKLPMADFNRIFTIDFAPTGQIHTFTILYTNIKPLQGLLRGNCLIGTSIRQLPIPSNSLAGNVMERGNTFSRLSPIFTNMRIVVKTIFWWLTGILLVWLACHFSIGSREYWQEAVARAPLTLFLSRMALGTGTGMVWAAISHFLHRHLIGGQIRFRPYFLLSTVLYIVIATVATLFFIESIQ